MKFTRLLLSSAAALAVAAPGLTHAALAQYNLSLPKINQFDNAITATGASVTTVKLVNGQVTYTSSNNGFTISGKTPNQPYTSNGMTLSGSVMDIGPAARSGDVIPGDQSGFKLTFTNPINAIGFEIGDWATCCTNNTRSQSVVNTYGVPANGSGLWIAFNGGAAQLTANALSNMDNPGFKEFNSFTNFIGAIDTSNTFTGVNFFGDGFGEVLFAGGTIRFATLSVGSTPGQPSPVPEPASAALLGLAALGVAGSRRRRKA